MDLLCSMPPPPKAQLSELPAHLILDADWETRLKAARWILALDKVAVEVSTLDVHLKELEHSTETLLRTAAKDARIHLGTSQAVAEEQLPEAEDLLDIDELFQDLHACDNALDCY